MDPKTCSEMLLNELFQFSQTQNRSKLTLHLISKEEQVGDVVKKVFRTYIDKMSRAQKGNESEDEPVIDKTKKGSSHDQVILIVFKIYLMSSFQELEIRFLLIRSS